jgi:hypothetical protein
MPALSANAVHPALVTEQDFVSAQQIRAARPASDGQVRRFALAGLIRCGVCGRRLDSHWNHGRPTYRCRHGHTRLKSARTWSSRVAIALRDSGQFVVCDSAGWRLEEIDSS